MTTLTRPLGMTQTRQLLTFPANGYAPTVTAYLWGGGGGSGGADGNRLGGAGTGGGYVRAEFTAVPGDTIEITVGSAGFSGRPSSPTSNSNTQIFNTLTAIPNNSNTALPKATNTYISKWSAFLNQTGVWNTSTAPNGSTVDLSRTLTFDQTYTVLFPFNLGYLFTVAAYDQATVYLDGEELFSSGLNSWITQETFGVPYVANIEAGLHTVRIVATAEPGVQYGIFGVGLTIVSTGSSGQGGGGLNRTIFDTRNTPASPPLTIPNIQPLIDSNKTGSFSNLMNDFGMWESTPTASTCSRTYSVYFPYTASYTVQMSAANTATLSIDGSVVFTTPGSTSYTTAYTTDVTVSQGTHTVAFSATLTDPTIIGGVAILISKSWSGATGGLAGPAGSSGGGGGSGGATTLILNPGTTNETLLAVAVGGAGGGGAGASTTGQSEATAPGPRGLTAVGISNGQLGENQGLFYQDGGGGGGGGPGGPGGAGRNGFSGVGDSYGQAGSLGLSYRNIAATTGGEVIEPSGVSPGGTNTEYYSLVGAPGVGATSTQLRAEHGAAVFVVDAYGIQVRDDAIDSNWKDVKTAFVNVDGVWRQTFAAYIYQNNQWQMVIGGAALTFAGATTDYGILSRPSDYRPAPPPPPPPVTYDAVPRGGGYVANVNNNCQNNNSLSCTAAAAGGGGGGGGVCFSADTLVTMANGTKKKISDIKIGDWVFNFDGTQINQVLFVEQATDTSFGFLYSPDSTHAPFATANHPLYINGRLSSLDPVKTRSLYPWLGHTDLLETTNTAPAAGSTVYNLWTSGDHTFTVNGYGTPSMVGDGGVLRLLVEQGLISSKRASELLISFDGLGQQTVHGLYVLSQLLGKIDIKLINNLIAWVFADNARPVAQTVFYRMAQVVGSAVGLFKKN